VPRPAPAADRTVAILNFLAAHPDRTFALSELARRLAMNKATAHALVSALTRAGYLLRHPADKTYALGPALVAVGNAAAARQMAVVDYARDEMRALADELCLECVASAALGEDIVILAKAGQPPPLGLSVQVGQRLPLAPPLGTVFLAWSDPEEIDAWLRRLGPGATDDAIARYREAVSTVRRRGYSIGLEADARVKLGHVLVEDDTTKQQVVEELVAELGHDEYILLELEHSASYRLSHIATPVFGADGRMALALTLIGFRQQLTAEQVPEYAERLRQAALGVTKSIHGRAPDA
jgi:DNA-binding IclR family transcriptional regulator